jgi:dimethylargininase
MPVRLAITREVSRSLARCELTHLERQPIDVDLARGQHARYERALGELGFAVLRLPEDPDLPDSVFVEDPAVVFDELAVITLPGAASRRPEVEPIAEALAPYRRLARIVRPATLDGGDVLRVGRRVWVGLTGRTTLEGVAQLERILVPHGYEVREVSVGGCLHLKSAATQVAPDTVLVNPAWVDPAEFEGLHVLEIDPDESAAANALFTGNGLIYRTAYPKTGRILHAAGFATVDVDLSELAKAEGAVTCCSLILTA